MADNTNATEIKKAEEPKIPGKINDDELEQGNNEKQKETSNLSEASNALENSNKEKENSKKEEQEVSTNVEKANAFVNKQSKKVRQAKYTKLNYMTIPQLQAGKKILTDKIADQNVPEVTKIKLRDMYAEYEKSEAKINNYYRAIETNPLTRGFVRGQRNLLTIAQIRAQANGDVFDRDSKRIIRAKRALADWMRAVNFDKIALGTGIALMGVGVMNIKFGEKTLAQMLGKMLGEFITKNPAAFGLLVSGASLIALSKIIPAIDRKHRKMVKHRAMVNATFNDMAKAETANENNFDASKLDKPKMSDADELELGSALCDNESLKNEYINAVQDPNSLLTRTQKLNILKALKKANELKKELDDELNNSGVKKTSQPENKEEGKETAEPTTSESESVNKTNAVKEFEAQISTLALGNSKKLQEAIQNDPNLSEEEKSDLIQKTQQAASTKSDELNASKFGLSVEQYRKVREQAKANGLTIKKQIEANKAQDQQAQQAATTAENGAN